MKPRLNLILLLALHVPYQLLLATESLLSLWPGRQGRWLRKAVDTIQGVFCILMYSAPQELVNVDVEQEATRVRVVLNTWGVKGGE